LYCRPFLILQDWMSAPADSCLLPPLVLAGAHHRSGSEMLTRMMGALCKRCFELRHWKRARALCAIDADVGLRSAPFPNVSALLAAHSAGLRLLSSGHWTLPLQGFDGLVDGTSTWRMVHLVRAPLGLVISAYHYHQTTNEPWALEAGPRWYARMGLAPPLPLGMSFAEQLRRLNSSAGIQLQAQHSLRLLSEMVAVAEACRSRPAHCTNLWLEDVARGFDAGATALLRAIGAPRSVQPQLLLTLRRTGRLSDAQRAVSPHVTDGKHDAERGSLLVTLRASPFGPALARLDARLRDDAPPPCGAHDSLYHSLHHSTSSRLCGCSPAALGPGRGGQSDRSTAGWWASDEPIRTVWLPKGASEPPARLAQRCCELCRTAVDPGCVYFNARMAADATSTTSARAVQARCTLLTSRAVFHPSRRAVTGEI